MRPARTLTVMVLEDLTPAQVAAASSPPLTIGHGVLHDSLSRLGRFAIYTMPEPWGLVDAETRGLASSVVLIPDMERVTLDRFVAECPDVDAVVGLGGGASVDAAKYVGWRTGRPVITAPTIVSVDASVTNTIAVREQSRVNYVGFVIPRQVVVELDIVQQAPARLNRAGIGDILSIHTGSFDWRVAGRAGKATVDEPAVARAARLVEALYANAGQIRAVTDSSLDLLIRAYIENNALCLEAGTAQPEEGSEHFWAYHVESLTGRTFVHGELVSLGVLIMSHLQQNQPDRVRQLLDEVGILYQPRDLGISRDELRESLLRLPAYITAEGHWYTIVNEQPPDLAFVERVAGNLEF